MCLGLLVTCVGLGDRGYRTTHCRLLGPALLTAGAALVLLALLSCLRCCRPPPHSPLLYT